MADITTNTSNLIVNDGGTYNVYNGAIVDGTAVSSGVLQANTANGNATIKNITVYGGNLLVRREGNLLDTITVSAGTLNVQAGGSAVNLDIRGGTVNADTIGWGGGYMSAVRVSAGTVQVANGNTVYDGSLLAAGARVHVSSGAVWYGGDVNAGAAFVSSAGIWSGGMINGGEIDNINAAGGGLVNDISISNGYLFVRNGNVAANLTLLGVTGNGYVAIQNGGVASNVDLYNRPKFYTQSGTIDNLTVHAGAYWNGNQGASNTIINTLTVEGYAEIYGTTVVNGGTFAPGIGVYVYNGVTLNGVKQTAGNVVLSSGAIWNNGEFAGGITYVSNGVAISGGKITGGEMRLFDPAGNTLVNGATVSGGTLIIRSGNVGTNITAAAGNVYLQEGGVMSGVDFTGGNFYAISGTVDDLTVQTGAQYKPNANFTTSNVVLNNFTVNGYAEVKGTTVVNGGVVAGRAYLYDGATFRNVSVAAGARVYLSSGAVWSGGDVAATGAAAAVAVSNGALISGVRLTGANGEIDVIDAAGNARAENVTVSNGYLFVYSATNSIADIVLSGGSTIVNRGGVASNVDIYFGNNKGRFLTYSGTVNNLTVHAGAYWNGNSGTSNTVINNLTVEGYAEIYGTTIINGGTIAPALGVYAYNNVTFNNVRQTAGNLILSSGAVLNNGEISGGKTIVSSGATASGGIVDGGELDVLDANGGGLANDITVSNGTLLIRNAGNTGANLTLRGGSAYLQDGAISGVDIYNGAQLLLYSGMLEGATVHSGGLITSFSTPAQVTYKDITVEAGGSMLLTNNFILTGETNIAEGAEIYLSATTNRASGVTASNGVIKDLAISGIGGTFADGVTLSNFTQNANWAMLSSGVIVSGFTQTAGNMYVSSGATIESATIGAYTRLYAGASVSNAELITAAARLNLFDDASMTGVERAAILAENVRMSGGQAFVRGSNATGSNYTVYDGDLYIQNGGTVNSLNIQGGTVSVYLNTIEGCVDYNADRATVNGINATGGSVFVGDGGVVNLAAGNTVNNLNTEAGAQVKFVKGAMLTGDDTNITEGTIFFGDTAVAGHAANGVLDGLAIGNAQFSIGDGIIATNAVLNNGSARLSAFAGANISGATVTAGAIICAAAAAGSLDDVTINGGQMNLSGTAQANRTVISKGTLFVNASGNMATGTEILSGGVLQFRYKPSSSIDGNGAKIEDTTIKAGGRLAFETGITAVDTGKLLTLDFTGATTNSLTIDDLGLINTSTAIVLKGEATGTYTIATTGATDRYVQVGDYEIFGGEVKAGETFGNAFTGKRYEFNGTGTAITVDTFTVGTKTGDASALTNDDAIAGGRAVKWDSSTNFTSGNVFLAGDMTGGQAWVEIDGYEGGAGTTLYGAQGSSFASGTVNILAKSGSLRNLAAGAGTGGSVKAVNLSFDGATLNGVGYAGGFGNVTGEVKTEIATGTIAKDFYAGALANKLDSVTSVGNVAMTVDGGTFGGNIYGASAVKTVAGKNGTRHTAGDVTLTVTGGLTTKGTQACIFAGGYATGDATGTVYKVDSVTLDISGGDWGEACGGRGVFGGIMASGVEAQVIGAVNITISGDATMGNVYGGGWAQKTGAKSIVGNVNISIEGGTITNVFGGGTHSTSGGSTVAGDVTITVSGGNVTGAIYARGQLDGDTTGSASVIFTGATDFGCDVFGYSYVGGAASNANLSYTGYTGEFSGALGGFNGIKFDGATAMELTTAAADVSNGAWEFDLTDRASTLAGTSLLTWSSASFVDDTIKVTFADEAQAKGDWNIATVAEAFSGTTFNVEVDGTEIASGLAYNQQIASGDYAGWGFELESGVLKFKNLASA